MLDGDGSKLGREILSWDGDSIEDVLGLKTLGGRVPGRQLGKVEKRTHSLEQATTGYRLLSWTAKY
jgi:hypothetical protein